jgi:DNA repair exonuclease SbcCD ATPase subunit
MEEAKSRPGFPGDRAQVAAEKLRALRERANQALGDHRKRLAQIETELSDRVRQLAEEFESAAEGIEKHLPGSRDAEVAALREQLEENRAKHEKFVEQLSLARKQIDAIQSEPCPACDDAAQQLADAQSEIRQLRDQLATLEQQRQDDRSRNEKVAEQVAAARLAIGDLQTRASEQASQLQSELDEALAARQAADERAAAATRDLESLQGNYDKLEQENQSQEKLETALAEERARATAELEKTRGECEHAERRLAESEAALAAAHLQADSIQDEAAKLETANAKLADQITALQAAHAAEHESLSARLLAAEQEAANLRERLSSEDVEVASLQSSLAEATAARDELQAAVEAAHGQIDALEQEAAASVPELERQFEQFQTEVEGAETARAAVLATLDATKAELAALKETTCPRADLDALQHKFGVTLSEVQKLKRENSELREAASASSANDGSPSPELIAVRQERDALAARVAELESMPAPEPAPAADDSALRQQMEDLQQRFEMTLDDLRKANQVNHELRGQLATAQSSAGSAISVGGSDWASQRARLMAMLEDEECEGVTDAARKKERATIENTIAATDRALAEKERELADLRANGAAAVVLSGEQEDQRVRNAAVDADEAIAAEREKLAKLQAEWEEKLRAAELEVSLERAKLAREQAALKEKMFEFQKADPQGILANDADGKPRRRWLAALGLGEEGEDGGTKSK